MPYVKPSDKTTEKLRGWLIFNPNKPRKKLDEGPPLIDRDSESGQEPSTPGEAES